MRKMKRMMAFILCLGFLLGAVPMQAMADATVLPTDVSTPSAGDLFVDVPGQFLSCGSVEALRGDDLAERQLRRHHHLADVQRGVGGSRSDAGNIGLCQRRGALVAVLSVHDVQHHRKQHDKDDGLFSAHSS